MQRKAKRKKIKRREKKPIKKPIEPLRTDRPTQQTVQMVPFSPIRDAHQMPFKTGQGITLVGWQFEIVAVLGDGSLGLRPVGRLVSTKSSLITL